MASTLNISPELASRFLEAQGGGVRYMTMQIVGEDVMSTGGVGASEDEAADWAAMTATLTAEEPVLIAFCLDPLVAAASHKWVLFAFVPDDAPVKQKYLYASSRDNIKKGLGRGYFTGEYYASSLEDASYEAYTASTVGISRDVLMTESEKLLKEEAKMEKDTERFGGMAVLPFRLMPDAQEALASFSAGDVNWVELIVDVEAEVVNAGDKRVVSPPMAPYVHASEPRYYALLHNYVKDGAPVSHNFFVYSCPEGTHVKQRMMYSTIKATVITACQGAGLYFQKTLEVTSPADLDTTLLAEAVDVVTGDKPLVVETAFARPRRPGRGRARITRGRGRGRGR